MKKSFVIVLFSLALSLSGCVTSPAQDDAETGGQIVPKPGGEYPEILSHWTQHGEAYQSLAASFKVTATLLSRDVVEQQVYLDSQNTIGPQHSITTLDKKRFTSCKRRPRFLSVFIRQKMKTII